MHSPFPGMNPYLEQYWGDIHHRLITYSSDAIQKQLPGDLRARVDERVVVEPEEGKPRDIVPEGHRTPYAACARRGWKPLEIEYYRLPLRERLPAIAVPLRQADHDVALDLQTLIEKCYEEARYDDDIDYVEEPDPPLDKEHAQWADALLREHGRR
jgi:hypothetical protein